MSFINRILSPFKGSSYNFNRFNSFVYGRESANWVSVTDHEVEYYMTIPQLYTVINRRASMYSNAKIRHIKNGEPVENSDYLDLIKNPNPIDSRNEFLYKKKISDLIWGNSFVNKVQGSFGGNVLAMNVLPSEQIKVKSTGKIYKQIDIKDIILGYKLCYDDGTAPMEFESDEVWHSTNYNPKNPIMGISPMNALKYPISNIIGAYKTRNVLIYNKGAFGILSNKTSGTGGNPMPLTPDERKRIEEQHDKNYGIQDHQSKIMMTNASLEWQSMSFPTKDLMLFEEINDDTMAIIDAYGLNSNIFSREKGTTFENLKEGIKLAYQDTIIPDAKDDFLKLSQFLGMDGENEYLEPDYSHIPMLAEDGSENAQEIKTRTEVYNMLVEGGRSDEEAMTISGLDNFLKDSI